MPKKKTALTIEERLQQALVPAEEQPYEVPENWVWVRLGSLLKEIKNGTTIKQDKSGNGFSVTRIESLQNQTIDLMRVGTILETEKIKETDWYKSGDITLSHINSIEHVGKTALITDAMLPLVHGMNLLRLRFFEIYTPDLFQLYSQTYQYKNEIRSRINMAVNQVSINQKQLSSLEIPLPPLSEQQRIVERIEELFAKLDEAKERLQEVADSFAVRKAAILHKAFTGELIGKQVTELVPLENLVDLIKIGPFGSSLHESDYIENGIPLVNPKHIVQQRIVPQSKIAISDEKAEELSSYKLKENDIVLGRRGEMGRCAPISNREENWICGTGSMIIRLKKEYDAKLYSLILGSQATVTYLENSAVGSTLKNLNEKIVRKIPVPQFSNEEQHEIVRLIDDLLARERAAQQAAEQALASIDLMKKSILARAFRGELGTNKASEASALELLRQVLAED